MNTEKLYEENQDFKEYVDKASRKRNRPVKEILELRMANFVAEHYEEKANEQSRNKE